MFRLRAQDILRPSLGKQSCLLAGEVSFFYKMRARKPLASAMGMIASVGRGRVFTLSQVRQFAVFFKNGQIRYDVVKDVRKEVTQDAQSV
jgi:hypothetical protein